MKDVLRQAGDPTQAAAMVEVAGDRRDVVGA